MTHTVLQYWTMPKPLLYGGLESLPDDPEAFEEAIEPHLGAKNICTTT